MAGSIGTLIKKFCGELWGERFRGQGHAQPGLYLPRVTRAGDVGAAVVAALRGLVRGGSADFRNEIVELVCDGGLAALRLRCTGTHTGLLLGLPAMSGPDRAPWGNFCVTPSSGRRRRR